MNSSICSINCMDFVSDSFIYIRLYKLKLKPYAFLFEDSLYVFIWDGRLNYVIYYHVRTYVCQSVCVRMTIYKVQKTDEPCECRCCDLLIQWLVTPTLGCDQTRKSRTKYFVECAGVFTVLVSFMNHDFLRAMLFRISCKILNSLWLKLMNSENFGFVCL